MEGFRSLESFSHANKPLLRFLEDHKNWLRRSGGERADLRGALLRGADMSGVHLVGANLREADLEGACLNRADLRGADLGNARLDRAVLIRSRLISSNLQFASLVESVTTGADFTEAGLTRADLTGAGLNRAVLRGAILREAALRRADLVMVDLRDAALMDADLSECILSGADLSGANLCGCRLRGANLLGADLSRVDLRGADLREAKAVDSLLMGSNLTRADLTGASLHGVCLEGAELSGSVVKRTLCNRLLLSKNGEVLTLELGDLEEQFSRKETILEFSLSIPMASTTAYLSKFLVHALNEALGSPVIAWKGLEAVSMQETKIVMACSNGDFREETLKETTLRLERALNEYFRFHPLRRDYLYLGDMLAGSENGAIDFESCPSMLHMPRPPHSAMVKEEILEAHRTISSLCEALGSIVRSVFGKAGAARPDATVAQSDRYRRTESTIL